MMKNLMFLLEVMMFTRLRNLSVSTDHFFCLALSSSIGELSWGWILLPTGAFLPTKRTGGVSTSEVLQRSMFPSRVHPSSLSADVTRMTRAQSSKDIVKEITMVNFERLDIQNCVRGKGVKPDSVVASGRTRLDGVDKGERVKGGGQAQGTRRGEERRGEPVSRFPFDSRIGVSNSITSCIQFFLISSTRYYIVFAKQLLSSLFAKCRFFDFDFLFFRSLGLHRFAQLQLSLQDRLFVAVLRPVAEDSLSPDLAVCRSVNHYPTFYSPFSLLHSLSLDSKNATKSTDNTRQALSITSNECQVARHLGFEKGGPSENLRT